MIQHRHRQAAPGPETGSGRGRGAGRLVASCTLTCIIALATGLSTPASAADGPARATPSADPVHGVHADPFGPAPAGRPVSDPFLAASVLAGSGTSVHRAASGSTPAPSSAGSAQPRLDLGMADPELLSESAPVQQIQLADMKDTLHMTSVRIDANWAYVQYAGPDTYDWHQYDRLVRSIRAAGMGIDFLIDGTPSWASASGNLFAQPDDPGRFGAWAGAVAARYGSGGPTTYEIGNEPNNDQFWQPAPDPAAYTADLIAAYRAIKSVQPDQIVISGGLAPEPDDGSNIDAVTFLADMYADGAGGSFDAVGYHAYSYPVLPDTPESWSGWTQLATTSPSIRSVMADNGDSGKQVWLTEVGWPTDTSTLSGISPITAQVDDATEVLSFVRANPWIGPTYWFSYQDSVDGPFGLVASDGTPRPAYRALAALG